MIPDFLHQGCPAPSHSSLPESFEAAGYVLLFQLCDHFLVFLPRGGHDLDSDEVEFPTALFGFQISFMPFISPLFQIISFQK